MKKLFAIFMMVAAMAACNREELPLDDKTDSQPYTITIAANKGDDVSTRGLVLEDDSLNAKWEENEVVEVYQGGSKIGELLAAASETASTTLTGSFEAAPSTSEALMFYYHTADTPSYANQDGTLETIASSFDFYAPATVAADKFVINNKTKTVTVPGGISFGANQQAIIQFILLDKDNSAAISPSALTITDGTSTVSLADIPAGTYTANGASNILFVAFPAADAAKTINLTATVGSDEYTYQKSGVTFSKGQFYEITVKMTEVVTLSTALTFEAITAGAEVTFSKGSSFSGTVQYSTDCGKTWTDYAGTITLAKVGDKVLFRGNNSAYYSGNASKFICSKDCYLYGNIMSLISATDYRTANTLGNNAFREMFKGNAHIKSHASKKLILPATTIGDNCYAYTFQNSSLTTPPEILATTLNGTNCCIGMFAGSSLTSVPELHVTQLVNGCFMNMFNGCTSLTSVPADYLPYTTLTTSCYEGMFRGCTGLTNVPELPAPVLAEKCYIHMFRGAGMTTVPNDLLSAVTTMASHCCESMFRECPNLTNAPEIFSTNLAEYCCNAMFYHSFNVATAGPLHATTLVTYCYYNMYNSCRYLKSVTCYATDVTAENCTAIWLHDAGTLATGEKTFITPSTTSWSTGTGGIPDGWTRVNL